MEKSQYEGMDEYDMDIYGVVDKTKQYGIDFDKVDHKLHIKLPPREITLNLVNYTYTHFTDRKEISLYDLLVDEWIKLMIDFDETVETYPFDQYMKEIISSAVTEDYESNNQKEKERIWNDIRGNVEEIKKVLPYVSRRQIWKLIHEGVTGEYDD